MPKKRWLKKYTRLEHLEEILQHQQLYLGNPEEWDDKNDSECIRLYSDWCGGFDMRATCLTGAPDRFHFWHIFGEREKGVCLWFKDDNLCKDIENDSSLIAGKVEYPKRRDLPKVKPNQLPFTKREQYSDECEFRVLRVSSAQSISNDKFAFSALSLKRIYLNPWLSAASLKEEKLRISEMIGRDFSHVSLEQNRSLKKRSWINEVSACVESQ